MSIFKCARDARNICKKTFFKTSQPTTRRSKPIFGCEWRHSSAVVLSFVFMFSTRLYCVCVFLCLCMCVCERERQGKRRKEREREGELKREGGRGKDRVGGEKERKKGGGGHKKSCVCACECLCVRACVLWLLYNCKYKKKIFLLLHRGLLPFMQVCVASFFC